MLVSLWLSGRISDWCLSQLGFDPSFGNLPYQATLKGYDKTKQSVENNIYIYIYIYLVLKKIAMYKVFLKNHFEI